MNASEIVRALRYCDKVANNTENTLQCGVCPLFDVCEQSGEIAADLIEQQQTEIDTLKQRLTEHEPVLCKDCVYWINRKIKIADGSYRDYEPWEEEFVTITKGINVGSHCTLHGFEDESGSWFWAGADDFCSRGIRR
ncbi:MAG: hypothetical protein RSD74_02085 [Angelakisella sp.]